MSLNKEKNKVIVIGLDGSSWDLVNIMLAEGKLPNLKKMRDQGVATTMMSTHPAHSAPAWTTFATGVQPTDHGCLDFLVVNKDIDDLDIIDSTKITQETIYETMVRHGKTPLLINLPNTFPPKLKNTTTITSLMTRGERFIFPESLKDKYDELKQYRLSPNAQLRAKDQFEPYIADVCQLEADRIAAAKQLFLHEQWDFFFFLSSGTDWVSHVAYDKALRERYQPAWKVWELMDEFLGWIMEQMDDTMSLFVMSDHGFKVYDDIFYMNRWLENNHYLTTTSGSGSFQQDHTKLSQEVSKVQNKKVQIKVGKKLRRFLSASPLLERISKWFYNKIVKRYIPVTVKVDLKLDLSKTTVAFPRGSMASTLYINDNKRFVHGIVPADDRVKLTAELKAALQGITDQAGQPVIGAVFTTAELYGAAGIVNSPDLWLDANNYYLSGSLHSSALFEHTTKNYHDSRGMLLAYGRGIEHRAITETNIVHMAPTILQSLGLPVQAQFAGQPIDLFSSDFNTTHPVVQEHYAERKDLNAVLDEIDF